MIKFLKKTLPALALGLVGLFLAAMTNAESTESPSPAEETLVLGGGCFWCLEALYETLEGVTAVRSGYAGGNTPNPTYEQIGTGGTGHAEVVEIRFRPETISIDDLLEFFWEAHDPTTLNRQGADVGPQYRSIILPADPGQRRAAETSMARAADKFQDPIVTEIKDLDTFWEAEGYHQDYFAKNPNAAYCRYVIVPKLKKLER
jgi:peptide-methionine (S)-S-oxide reductase